MRWSTASRLVTCYMLCCCLIAGCGGPHSPERAALAIVEAEGHAKSALDDSQHVVSITSSTMTDAVATHFAALPHLKSLTLSGSPIGDVGLQSIGLLTKLQVLQIDKSKVTDAGLHHLSRLHELRELNLAGCQITDVGLKSLAGLTQLTTLNLNDTQIQGAGLAQLSGMTHLESLYLQNTTVDFEGLPPLTGLSALKLLHLARTKVGGGIVRAIAGLPKLERLYLNGTRLQDADIPALAAVLADNSPHLKGLFVEQTELSDAALEPLHPLAQLTEFTLIHVQGTRITKNGVVRLRGLLPEVNVVSQH